MKEKWKHWEQVFWHKVEKGLPFLLALVPIHAMLLCFRPDGILLSSAAIALFGSLGILLFLQGSIMQDMANMQTKVETIAKGILAKEQAGLVLVSKEELQQMDGQPIETLAALLLYPDVTGAVHLLAEGVNTAQKDVVEAALQCFQEVLQKKKR